jgi:hypothetical protein
MADVPKALLGMYIIPSVGLREIPMAVNVCEV